MKRLILASQSVAAALVLGITVAQAATPSHFYPLDNSLADALGGPSLLAAGGSLAPAGGYDFGPSLGLSLPGVLSIRSYTIDMKVTLAETTGYRKLIDFKNLTTDDGLYNFSSALAFFPGDAGLLTIAPDVPVRITFSRDDSTGQLAGYTDGVLQFTVADPTGYAVFDGPQNVGHFFIDDFASEQGEGSAGHVDYIAIYGTALPESEVAILNSTIPEPGVLALALGGLGMMGWTLRRR